MLNNSKLFNWKPGKPQVETFAQPLYAGLMGDSITLQHTTTNATNKIINSVGYVTMLNFMTGNRFRFGIADNYGGGGGDLASMDVRKATDLGGKGYEVIFFLGGANDIPATTTLASMIASATSLQNYVTDTLGIPCVIGLVPPRTQEAGVPLTSDMITKLNAFNGWLRGRHNGTSRIVLDWFAALTSDGQAPAAAYFKPESGKLLHPNPEGALIMAQQGLSRIKSRFGVCATPSGTNILTVGNMTGAGGTLSTNASGQIATGWTAGGFGGTGGRVLSKTANDKQRVDINLPDGAGAAASLTLEVTTDPTTGYAVGNELYGWLDIEMHSGSFADGPYLEVRDVGTSTLNYIGMNKAGSTTGFMPLNQMGRGLIRTPNFVVQAGNTKLEYLIRSQAHASGHSSSQAWTVHGAGIVNLSA